MESESHKYDHSSMEVIELQAVDGGAPVDVDEEWEHSFSYTFPGSNIIKRSTYRRLMLRLWFYRSRFFSMRAWKPWVTGQEGIANLYFVIWFILNIVITLLSKAMFTNFHFPYPMMLTAVHLGVTWMGAQIASSLNLYKSARVSLAQLKGLIIFSLVFTINIWLSNYALMVVSVSVHQVFRTTIPLFTMILSLALYNESYPWRMLPSVLLVILGVCATVWGDLGMTIWGGIVVAAGCAFSSLKGIMSQKAQIGSQGLETFDLLRCVCPMAVAELLIWGLFNGEVGRLVQDPEFTRHTAGSLLLQGLLALALNFVSFKCAALKNPLTMNIAGNVKQVVTPLVAIWLGLGGAITLSLMFGLVTTFFGAIWYGNEASRHKAALKAAYSGSQGRLTKDESGVTTTPGSIPMEEAPSVSTAPDLSDLSRAARTVVVTKTVAPLPTE